VRWVIVLPFARPGLMGVDFADELTGLGHEVRLFPYRRDNPVYKNRSTKAAYQGVILRKLERTCAAFRPDVVLVIKGGPITPDAIRRVRERTGTRFVNVFPDNPLWMIPFDCLEAYDLFFTKERYAMRALASVGLRNLHYLPMYCVPEQHHPVTLTDAERARYGAAVSLVGSRYPYRERLVRELADYPLRVWGAGWGRATAPEVRRLAAGGPVHGRAKLCVYAGSTVSLNPHHPMNDIVGVNTRAFELAAAGVCQVADDKEDLATLLKPGEEVLVYRDPVDLRRRLDACLARPDEARAIGANARRRALAEHTLRHRIDEMLAVLGDRFALDTRPARPHASHDRVKDALRYQP
jgi:spore maturation protein CgeB